MLKTKIFTIKVADCPDFEEAATELLDKQVNESKESQLGRLLTVECLAYKYIESHLKHVYKFLIAWDVPSGGTYL